MAIVPPFCNDTDDLLYALLSTWQTGITDIIMRTGSADLVAGANIVKYGTSFSTGANYVVLVNCADGAGGVDYLITSQDETGFEITVAADCTCVFIAQLKTIVNNQYRIGSGALAAGVNNVNYCNPFPAGTDYVIVMDCADGAGGVDYLITSQDVNGFVVNAAAACNFKFMAYVKNDVPTVS